MGSAVAAMEGNRYSGKCGHCGFDGEQVVGAAPKPHFAKVTCSKCGKYMKWLPDPSKIRIEFEAKQEQTMTTALAVYDRVSDPTVFIREMGTALAKSQLFGCETYEQGMVIMLDCIARGIPPLMMAEEYDIIHNRLSMKAETMLAKFIQKGGEGKMIRRDAEVAEILLTKANGESNQFRFTWEEAKGEPFIYVFPKGKGEQDVAEMIVAGKAGELKIRAKYATPRARTQMLWARLLSDSIPVMDATIRRGRYTPEEIDDFSTTGEESSSQANGTVATTAKPKRKTAAERLAEQQQQNQQQPTQEASTGGAAGEPIDAEFTVSDSTGTEPAASTASPASPVDAKQADKPQAASESTPAAEPLVSDEFRNKLAELLGKAYTNPDPAIAKNLMRGVVLSKGVNKLGELTQKAAEAFAEELQDKLRKDWAAAQVAKTNPQSSKPAASEFVVKVTDPATQVQVDQIKSLVGDIGMDAKMLCRKFIDESTGASGKLVADLNQEQATLLIRKLFDMAAGKHFGGETSTPATGATEQKN